MKTLLYQLTVSCAFLSLAGAVFGARRTYAAGCARSDDEDALDRTAHACFVSGIHHYPTGFVLPHDESFRRLGFWDQGEFRRHDSGPGRMTLASSAGSSEGILCQFTTANITARNGTVRGFGAGVHLGFISGAKVENVTAANNAGRGIYVDDGSAVIDCVAIRNGDGWPGIEAGANCDIRACRSYGNWKGLVVSDNTVIRDSISASNSQEGFQVGKASRSAAAVHQGH